MVQNSWGFGFSVTHPLCSVTRNCWLLIGRESFASLNRVMSKTNPGFVLWLCLFWDFFFSLMSTDRSHWNWEKTAIYTFLGTWFKKKKKTSRAVLCKYFFRLNSSFEESIVLLIMQTSPQKARPYGGCLITTLTTRKLGTQGQFLTPATTNHKETVVLYIEVWRNVWLYAWISLKHVLCLWFYSLEFFHADNKVYLPTQHVLGLQLK